MTGYPVGLGTKLNGYQTDWVTNRLGTKPFGTQFSGTGAYLYVTRKNTTYFYIYSKLTIRDVNK
jgi:hypothetical protein